MPCDDRTTAHNGFVKRRLAISSAYLAALLLFSFSITHQRLFSAGTPVSRLDLLHSLVENNSWNIDSYHTNTTDKAIFNGHYYSDKAPGTAALALPAFSAATLALKLLGIKSESRIGWLVTSWVACVFSQALPAALGGALLFVWLGQFVSQRLSLLTVAGLFLGCLPLPYSTLLFSHAQVVGLLAIAVWGLNLFVDLDSTTLDVRLKERLVLAGFCVGLALASEYTAGLVVIGFGLYVFLHRREGLWPFVIGAVVPLLLIPAYSWVTLGDPFTLPYSHEANFLAMKEGLYAIKMPDLENLGRLLLSPTRGLVFWTPFLMMAVPGAFNMARCRSHSLWFVYYLPVLHMLVISGRLWDWRAGPTISARYMAPILPLLALPCAFGVRLWPRLGLMLLAYSVGITTIATLTDACPEGHIYNPLLQRSVPLFLKGDFSPNLGTVLGLPSYASVALFYMILVGGVMWLWKQLPNEREETPSAAKAEA